MVLTLLFSNLVVVLVQKKNGWISDGYGQFSSLVRAIIVSATRDSRDCCSFSGTDVSYRFNFSAPGLMFFAIPKYIIRLEMRWSWIHIYTFSSRPKEGITDVTMAALRPQSYLSQHAFSASLLLGSFFVLIVVTLMDHSSLTVSAGSSSSTSKPNGSSSPRQGDTSGLGLDVDLLGSFGSYPNVLSISQEDRDSFHPVVIFPTVEVEVEAEASENIQEEQQAESVSSSTSSTTSSRRVVNLQVLDFTKPPLPGQQQLATNKQVQERRKRQATERRKLHARGANASQQQADVSASNSSSLLQFAVGRYDENRVGMYESDLFDDVTNDIDGFAGRRTVHMGIDLDAAVGTKVYSFSDAVVHAAGYNSDLGDYGNVIVLEHVLPSQEDSEEPLRKIYALYGHLDGPSIRGMTVGRHIRKGQILGRMGDIHENGGWHMPHVHFQLSVNPPVTHDMPGAVSLQDRPRALLEYPDPRLILGPLY
jgi:murein DD-endopeptidase MepM/ murein hydrolase activator NlpD